MQFGSSVLNVLEKSMDLNWLRQQLIADNIANVDTPQYKRQDIDFQKSLKKALSNTGGTDLQGNGEQPVFVDSGNTSGAENGNNVDMESELAQQSMNLLQYDVLARLESDQLGMLRTAIMEGRG